MRKPDIWQGIFKGAENGRRQFCGPHTVQIDLTDKCNNTCIACWVHSPLIDKSQVFPEGEKKIPFNLAGTLIDDLYKLGTREIILSGSGEPLLYPRIREVIKSIKARDIYLNIITNATLIDEEMAQLFVRHKVDLITASIWAGSGRAYALTHPGKTEEDFENIKSNLSVLAFYKKKHNFLKPHLKLYNVICSKNYNDIKEMVDFAKDVDCDSVEFQIVDVATKRTESLAIDNIQRKGIIKQLENIRKRKDLIFFNAPRESTLNDFTTDEFLDFGKIWKDYKSDFYVSQYSNSLSCKKGYNIKNERIVISESTSTKETHPAVFWYKFRSKICQNCEDKSNCLDDKKAINIKLMNILGLGSFLRRLLSSDLEKKIYEKDINSIPCYIGWYYSRILTNGDVIPCCKAAEFPLGNLYKNSFSKIWHSSMYGEFRFNAKNLSKTNPYFSKINCIKSCDNWGMNLEIHKRLDERVKSLNKNKDDLSRLAKKNEKYSYFRMLKQYISKKGLREALKKITYNFTPRNLKDRYLQILGVYDREYGYKGPFHVQIDLTNNCNNTCIACWCNSPLLKGKGLSEIEKRQYLPLRLVKELLDEISRMGATEVYYSGGGEPFMHPQIMEVLKYTKEKRLACHVNTNFTLLDRNKLDCLIDLGVDFLTVSIWAGTPKTFCKVHPGRTEQDFYRIKENLIYLNKKKKEECNKPLIKIYEVLFNMNYSEVEEMIEFAQDTLSESIEFTLADTIPNGTDILRLNEKQTQELIEICKNVKKGLGADNRLGSGLLLFHFDQFLRRISVVKDVEEAKYDRNIIDSMPCYIGWLFARIIPNGEVHSCLKAHRIPTGFLYKQRFSEIWNSREQVHFRKKTLVYQKTDPFFRLIGNDQFIKEAGCYKSCDDVGRNTWLNNRMKMLSMSERLVLKSAAKTLKIVRKIKPKKENYKTYHKDPTIAGILHGRKAFAGPERVVIDPTNKCNLRCISCWLYSPFLKENKPSGEWLRKELPKDRLIKLIDDLDALGTRRIRFTGGGEPFMHRDLMEVIEYARKKDFLVAITTNFGLVSKKDIKKLIDLGIEELCVSIWASNPKTYSIVHPGTTCVYFEELKENLLYLKEIRKGKPRITFANVIMNINFRDFREMYEFGLEYGADAIYFTPVDVFFDQTDGLLLNEEERKTLLNIALQIKEKNEKHDMQLEFFDGFLRRISNFRQDFEKGKYDRFAVEEIPCYAGWIFSRILADGSVVPCCRGVKKIMGNINEKSFKDIWNSAQYNEFRAKAKYLSKTDAYFEHIGCIKECDNLMHNEEMHRRINEK